MKRVVFGALAALSLCGCAGREPLPRPQEMGQLALVRIVGVDAAEEGAEMTVSTGARGQREALRTSAAGESVSAAAKRAESGGESRLFFGHADKLILGESAAETMLTRVVDYLYRSRDYGLGAQVWVVRDGTARQAIETDSGAEIALRLDLLGAEGEQGQTTLDCTVMELARAIAEGGSICLPALSVDETGTLSRAGYAVVRAGTAVCFIDGDAALGLELLFGRGEGRVDTMTLPDGTAAALSLGRVRVRLTPEFAEDAPTGLDVRLDLPMRVAQCARPLTEGELVWIEREAGILEGQRVVETLELAQYWDADFAAMLDKACAGDPLRSARLKEEWAGAFRGLDLRVQTHCAVERTKDVTGR